jgi:hypothetical protein
MKHIQAGFVEKALVEEGKVGVLVAHIYQTTQTTQLQLCLEAITNQASVVGQ